MQVGVSPEARVKMQINNTHSDRKGGQGRRGECQFVSPDQGFGLTLQLGLYFSLGHHSLLAGNTLDVGRMIER